jgi:hypothetical protein
MHPNIWPEDIKRVEVVGDKLKIIIPSDEEGEKVYGEYPIKYLTPDYLFDFVVYGILDPSVIPEEKKKRIKKRIINGNIEIVNMFTGKRRMEVFKKLFKPGDFSKRELNKLANILKEDMGLYADNLRIVLEIAKYLGILDKFRTEASRDLKIYIDVLKNAKKVDKSYIRDSVGFLSVLLEYYPEFKEEAQKQLENKIDDAIKILKEEGDLENLKKLILTLRLKEYLVEVL